MEFKISLYKPNWGNRTVTIDIAVVIGGSQVTTLRISNRPADYWHAGQYGKFHTANVIEDDIVRAILETLENIEDGLLLED